MRGCRLKGWGGGMTAVSHLPGELKSFHQSSHEQPRTVAFASPAQLPQSQDILEKMTKAPPEQNPM